MMEQNEENRVRIIELENEIKQLRIKLSEHVRALYLASKHERRSQQVKTEVTTRSIFLKYLNQARCELEKENK